MKSKTLYALFIFILFTTGLSAQNYQPLVIEGAHWQAYAESENIAPYGFGFSIEGDSIYNGTLYKKVYELELQFHMIYVYDEDSTIVDWIQYDTYNGNKSLFGLLREDTAAQKVYSVIFEEENWLYTCESDEEQLLYDFSLNVGDTLITCSSITDTDGNYPFVVDSITIENRWGSNRRVFYQQQYFKLIEGLGINNILFHQSHPFLLANQWSAALLDYCVGTDEECLDYLIDATNDFSQEEKRVKLYPNPTNSPQIQIESLRKLPKNTVLYLFNAIGQEISQVRLPQQTAILTLPYRGVYYYKLVIEHQVIDSGMVERL